MIGGRTVVDAHVHLPGLASTKPAWFEWADTFSQLHRWRAVYNDNGIPHPQRVDDMFDEEGVDRVLLFCEYSPRVIGIQPIEDLLPIVEANPVRFRLVGNLNPHLHHPVAREVERQLDLGAVALKLHPVHAGFRPDDKELYAAYAVCAERGIPVIVHTGSSSLPGARSSFGNPEFLCDVIEEFRDVNFVFAHGGRGWWYDTAAFLATAKDNVWLDLAGLPPQNLHRYYARFDLERLAQKWIFGTDWPGVPGIRRNVEALDQLGLKPTSLTNVLSGNAAAIFPCLGL